MLDSYVLILTILLPFAGAFVVAFTPAHRSDLVRIVVMSIAILSMALASYIFVGYNHDLGNYQFRAEYQWLDSLGFNVTLKLGVDGISTVLILLNGIVFLTGALISWNIAPRNKEFFVLFCKTR